MPFDGNAGRGQLLARAVQGIDRDQLIGLAVDEEDRRAGGDLGEVLGPGQQARVAGDGDRGSLAPQADVQAGLGRSMAASLVQPEESSFQAAGACAANLNPVPVAVTAMAPLVMVGWTIRMSSTPS
jgi:hypothetical protein